MKKYLAVILITIMTLTVFATTGCSHSDGRIGNTLNTQVNLEKANFTVIRTVQGKATAANLFGIGISAEDLRGRAMRDMLDSAELHGKSAAIVNVTSDAEIWMIPPIFVRRTVYVSGDVVVFH